MHIQQAHEKKWHTKPGRRACIYFATVMCLILLGFATRSQWMGADRIAQSTAATALAQQRQAAPDKATGSTPPESVAPTFANELPITYRFYLDKEGGLIITGDIREIFDQFLTRADGVPADAAIANLKAYIGAQLHEPASATALGLLDAYVAMKTELSALGEPTAQERSDPTALKAWMVKRNALMKGYLGAAYEPFYGAEHRRDEYTIERLAIMGNAAQTPAQKRQAIEKMAAARYPDILHSEESQAAPFRLLQAERDMVKSGATAETIYNHRLQQFGPEAAERLQALDKRRSEWQGRLDQWQQKRSQILQADGLSDQEKGRQLQALQEQMFTNTEQKRLRQITTASEFPRG